MLLDSFWFEKYVVDWNYYDISTSEEKKIKIIQLSDLHIDKFRSIHKSIARKINKLNPDLLVITGDSVDKTENIKSLDVFLNLIEHSIKKYAILGNWEYWGNVDLNALKTTYKNNNCELLINENRAITIGKRNLNIIGIDDLIGGNANIEMAIKNIKTTSTNIILSHCPQYTEFISRTTNGLNIDIVLSGHTHGGQITFLGFAPFTPAGSGRYLKGWYTFAKTKMYVSKGIGTSILPIRFGARAEMVVIDL